MPPSTLVVLLSPLTLPSFSSPTVKLVIVVDGGELVVSYHFPYCFLVVDDWLSCECAKPHMSSNQFSAPQKLSRDLSIVAPVKAQGWRMAYLTGFLVASAPNFIKGIHLDCLPFPGLLSSFYSLVVLVLGGVWLWMKAEETVKEGAVTAKLVQQETDKFRSHLMEKLSKKDIFETSVEEVVGICTGETDKFRSHLMEKLSKDIFETSVEEVVGICTGILSEFLQTEYGGPGTLLVIPFIDMADTINERGLPGAPQAARAAVVWAQKHVDKDWKEWTGSGNNN